MREVLCRISNTSSRPFRVIKKWQPLNEYGYSFILSLIILFIDSLIELFTELFIDLSIN